MTRAALNETQQLMLIIADSGRPSQHTIYFISLEIIVTAQIATVEVLNT
jgi:hypothetical protein